MQKQRERLFREQPLCVRCLALGLTVLATIRDHIIPLAEGGTDNDDNVQPLCKPCHDVKTAEESKRGKERARAARVESVRVEPVPSKSIAIDPAVVLQNAQKKEPEDVDWGMA